MYRVLPNQRPVGIAEVDGVGGWETTRWMLLGVGRPT